MIRNDALKSLSQLSAENKDLAVKLCDREDCLRRLTALTAQLQCKHDQSKCKCKYMNEICNKLRVRNEELEMENEGLKDDLKEEKERVKCACKEMDRLQREKGQMEEEINSQKMDLNKK